MARKLLAILLAISMVVPMVLSQVFAATPTGTATYTASKYYNGDANSGNHGYSWCGGEGASYPMKAYHLMARICIDWLGGGGADKDANIGWSIDDGHLGYGFNITNGTMFVAQNVGYDVSISDGTVYLAEEDFELEEGEYYQVDWFVDTNKIEGYVNGDLVLSYEGTKTDGGALWQPDAYIILYPYDCGFDLLDLTVVAQDGSATYCNGIGQWAWLADSDWSDNVVSETVNTYEIIDWAPYAASVDELIDAIGPVGYNEWVSYTDDNCMCREAYGAADWTTYDDVKYSIGSPYKIEIDCQIAENREGVTLIGGNPQNGGGAYLGYNVDTGKFFIAPNAGLNGHENAYANATVISDGTYTMDAGRIYTIGFVYGSNYVAVEFQGREIIRSTAYNFASGDFHFGATYLALNIYEWRTIDLASGVLLRGPKNFDDHSANGPTTHPVSCTGDKFVNSGAAIAAARAAYDALNADAQALVTKYSVLEAAEAAYAAKVQAVAQAEADVVIAAINAIGTPITLDSVDAIAAAEEAYANVDPAVQALVSNYATLTAARAQYDAYVAQKAALEAKIDSIGAVFCNYQARESDYDNTGMYSTGGYAEMHINGQSDLFLDYCFEADVQVQSHTAGAELRFGTPHYGFGYDFDDGAWVIVPGNSWSDLSIADHVGSYTVAPLYPDCVYTLRIEVKVNRITLKVDGEIVAQISGGTNENPIRFTHDTFGGTSSGSEWFIPLSHDLEVVYANYSFLIDMGNGFEAHNGADHLSGQALCSESATWAGRGGTYSTTPVAMHADAILDDGALIASCEADYAALDAYAKTIIDNYDVLVAARATYNALAADPAVGAVVAAINDLGEITLASGDAIADAEAAYAALDAAQQAQVYNYDVLVAARSAYNVLSVEAAIDAIGTVGYVADPSAVDDGVLAVYPNAAVMASYLHIKGASFSADYSIEFDFSPVSNDTTANAWFGFGMGNGNALGYSYSQQKFFLSTSHNLFGTAARQLDVASDVFPLEYNTIYHIKFEATSAGTAIYVDGVKVVESATIVRPDNDWAIWYPQACSFKWTNMTIIEGGNTLLDGVKGAAILTNTVFVVNGETGYNAAIGGVVPMLVDSESAILDARSAYDALTAAEQAQVSNYATLTAAEARYAELSNPAPAVIWGDANGDGEVDLDDAVAICNYDAGLIDLEDLAEGADANGDGEVDLDDAVAICNYDAGLIELEDLGPNA